MKRIVLFLMCVASSGLLLGAEADAEKIRMMESRLSSISDPAVRLFFQAGIEKAKGDPESALKTLSLLIVQHPHNEKWMLRSELMCAELYIDLGMVEAAEATIRQILFMYDGSDVADKARALREKIKMIQRQDNE
ncbi:MAG: hypothetical protein ISR84_03170 [Kiritimatiellales bacterium]|nr:hypothetical protein [Kiritimatiellales bacterium]